MMQSFHGYGDHPKSPGHYCEGGKPYLDIETKHLNPSHIQSLDVRMQAVCDNDLLAAATSRVRRLCSSRLPKHGQRTDSMATR